ncbi:MAG: hypothetical protein QM642_07715 [Edaphocola sp.]
MLMLSCCFAAQGQPDGRPNNNKRTKYIDTQADTVVVDTLSIDAGSFRIGNVPDTAYILLPAEGALVWKNKQALPADSVAVSYRILPLNLAALRSHKDRKRIETNIPFGAHYFNYGSKDSSTAKGFVDFNSIEYNGTYGRSLSLGNAQDLALNSNFNLQLNGYILDSVRIEAAVTDNNLPIQPDGNTQRLQEFDRIYITFEKGKHKLTAGDYNLERPKSYFINFNKRVQGLLYEDECYLDKERNIKNKTGISGSVAKGQFARNIFNGTEGNQGPYKLTGNNNEQFFIVLAGTEKVYIDGVKMERGEDLDYTINYNTGEITFMPRQLITKDKRIQFEFEYQDRSYLNTLAYAYDELQVGKKWNFRLNAYSNQDSKNQPYTQTLSGEQKRFLESIGDNTDSAYYRSVTLDTFSSSKILYRMTDTTVDGLPYDSVFVYSTNQTDVLYSLGFTYVGENNGHYIIAGTNTNGRSYSWVAPQDGILQGNYEPLTLLITPKRQQLFTLAGTYEIDNNKKAWVELAASNYAPNLFSDRDNNLHWGYAGKAAYEEKRTMGKADTTGRRPYALGTQLSYERVQSRFKAIAPYRNVEFSRDWNVDSTETAQDEHLAIFNTELSHRRLGKVNYNFTFYGRGNGYTGFRNVASIQYEKNGWRSGGTFNLMNSQNTTQRTSYFRPSLYIEKNIKKLKDITIGASFQREHDAIKSLFADTLLAAAFAFDIWKFYLKNKQDAPLRFEVNYTIRRDDLVQTNEFKEQSTGHTIDGTLGIFKWKKQQLTFTGAYRSLLVHIPTSTVYQNTETILGRFNFTGNIKKGVLVPSLLYEVGTGQEQQRIYTYVEVTAGQGVYMWNDYNEDGVQQANEFEIAVYSDQKKYIRTVTYSNEYIKVNYVLLNNSLSFNPENFWPQGQRVHGLAKFTSRWNNQLSLQISNRVLAAEGFKAFNPFTESVADTSIIANTTSLGNTVYFNRNSAVWGSEYTAAYNSGKSLLTYGIEGSRQLKHTLKLRYTIKKTITGNFAAQMGNRGYNSGLDDGRTYDVHQKNVEPSVTFILRSTFRITGGYKWENRQNAAAYGGETANIQSVNIDTRLTRPAIGTMQAKLTYASINYTGTANTSLSYVMLDALQNGNNWVWYLNWERRLGKGFELSIEYEGRKTGSSDVVHTGRMSVRAVL